MSSISFSEVKNLPRLTIPSSPLPLFGTLFWDCFCKFGKCFLFFVNCFADVFGMNPFEKFTSSTQTKVKIKKRGAGVSITSDPKKIAKQMQEWPV